MRKFILVSYAFPPVGVVGSLRPYRLCRYLPEKGWIPEVITACPRKGINLDHSLLKDIPSQIIIHQTKQFDIQLIISQFKNKAKKTSSSRNESLYKYRLNKSKQFTDTNIARPIIKKLKAFILALFSTPDHQVFWNFFVILTAIKVFLKEKGIRFILTTSPPHSSQLGGMIMSFLFRTPLIVDYRDPWTDINHQKKISTFRHKFEQLLESAVIKRATKVISSTEAYSTILKTRYNNLRKDKFITITNCFEEQKFSSIKPIKLPKFTITYLGIFYPHHNPYFFFDALSTCLEIYPELREDITLNIIGDGDPTTFDVLRNYKLLDITDITGRLIHECAIQISKSSDLLLLLIGNSELTPKGWVPSKLYEYLACKRPILAIVPEGEAARIVRKTKSGYVITSNDRDAIINVIRNEYDRKVNKVTNNDFRQDEKEIYKFSDRYTINEFVKLFQSI